MIITTNWIISMVNKPSLSDLVSPFLFLVVGVLIQPLFEELMFRGILLGAFFAYAEKFKIAKYFVILVGVIFSSYLFAGWRYIKWRNDTFWTRNNVWVVLLAKQEKFVQ